MSFITKYVKALTTTAGQNIMELLVGFDPENASQAQIEQMDSVLMDLSKQLVAAKSSEKSESADVDRINGEIEKYMSAADRLATRLESVTGEEAEKTEIALNKALDKIEELKNQLKIEQDEQAIARETLTAVQEAFDECTDRLKNAKETLKKAKLSQELAQKKLDLERQRSANAERLAGIRNHLDSAAPVLDAMNSRTQKLENETEALRQKREAIISTKPEDDLLSQALAGDTKPAESARDRLARLKGK